MENVLVYFIELLLKYNNQKEKYNKGCLLITELYNCYECKQGYSPFNKNGINQCKSYSIQ